MTKTNNLEVAQMILRQMGHRRLSVMIGAHNFVGSEKDRSLTFEWKADSQNGANAVTVSLEPSDTYTMNFFKIRGLEMTELAQFEDVYNDMLCEIFEKYTGLYLSF